MEVIYIPPRFAVLFILPLLVGFYVFDKTANTTLSLFTYIVLQVSLAIAGRIIYG